MRIGIFAALANPFATPPHLARLDVLAKSIVQPAQGL